MESFQKSRFETQHPWWRELLSRYTVRCDNELRFRTGCFDDIM